MRIEHRILIVILALGAYSQIVQALLIREGLVVFYGNEISLGAFYGSWLFWIAIGSLVVLRQRKRRWVEDSQDSLQLAVLALPLALAAQVVALRSVRAILDVSSSEFVPLGSLFLSLCTITLPSSLIIGIAFPLACKALYETSRDWAAVGLVTRLYVADALGALAGGVVFTFILIEWLGLVETWGLVTFGCGLIALSVGRPRSRRSWMAWLLAALGAALVVAPGVSRLDRALESLRFATLQPGISLLDAVDTRYGHLAVGRLGEQTSVVVDGQIRESFPLPREVQRDAAYYYGQSTNAKRVLVLGGFAAGLASELLHYPVERIDVVEQDRRGFETIAPYLTSENKEALSDTRLHLSFDDPIRFINRLDEASTYDLILVLSATPSSAQGNRYFTREFYQHVLEHLATDGVYCTHSSGASNYMGEEVGSFSASIYRTLESVFAEVSVAPGDTHRFCAATTPGRVTDNAAELARRYTSLPRDSRRFPEAGFVNLLPPGETAYLRERLNTVQGDINTDAHPVTYYLNMVLWGEFSASGFVSVLESIRAMGFMPYLLPAALFVLLLLMRTMIDGYQRGAFERTTATFVLVVFGVIAMATQMILLFSYQSAVGFIFERIALLNGLFMTGLAFGAAIGQRLAGARKASLYLLVLSCILASALTALPHLLDLVATLSLGHRELAYLGLTTLAGMLIGSGFPLGVAATHGDHGQIVQSGGLTQAADNLGGALGGLATGALLVPLLGIERSCLVLALLACVTWLPLAMAAFIPRRPWTEPPRGRASLPWRSAGWALIYCVALVYAWQLLGQNDAAPRVRFTEKQLSEVAGAGPFSEETAPLVYYVAQLPARAALSTLAGAPEVDGYGGPINILVAVDREGHLIGARYIDSSETPSYINGIEDWLNGLVGIDLSTGTLDLKRVDGLTGATVTSGAALAAIDHSAVRVGDLAFGVDWARSDNDRSLAIDPGLLATIILLAAFFPVYLSGSERARTVYLVSTIGVLGLWLNTFITETDLVNISMGHVGSPSDNPQRWLLIGFVAISGLLFGQAWCGYVCPFGALQDLIGRLGRRFGLRTYVRRSFDRHMRMLKYGILALMLVAVWLTGNGHLASFDPMQHLFSPSFGGWMVSMALVVLIGSLFYVRLWCRYLCPLGAALALTNKLALLQRWAPSRRYEHCDLGVRGDFDLDCIRCNRCITGRDTGIRHKRARQDNSGKPTAPLP